MAERLLDKAEMHKWVLNKIKPSVIVLLAINLGVTCVLRKTENVNELKQETGNDSTAYQAAGDINIIQTIDYMHLKEMVMDLFKANAYELTATAGALAKARAEEVIDKFLAKMETDSPESIESMAEPDMQYAVISAQKAYARTGDSDLSDVLVDILVDRSKQKHRDLMQIVLNEALEVAPKLTSNQFNLLSIIFIMRHVKLDLKYFSNVINKLEEIKNNLDAKIPKSDSIYTHLQYAGCGRVEVTSINLDDAIARNYADSFPKPMNLSDIEFLIQPEKGIYTIDDLLSRGIVAEIGNASDTPVATERSFVFRSDVDGLFQALMSLVGYSGEVIQTASSLNTQRADEATAKRILMLHPAISKLVLDWNESPAKSFVLSSVGIAIAHANIRRKIPALNMNLTIWINET